MWTTSKLDFAYPLELSSSIYLVKDIFMVINFGGYNNPNYLEHCLAQFAWQFSNTKPYLASFF